VRDGVLYLDGLLRPDTQAVAYAVVYVRSDRARAAALRLGSAGPIKVWWNGAEVLARDVVRPAALDQDDSARSFPLCDLIVEKRVDPRKLLQRQRRVRRRAEGHGRKRGTQPGQRDDRCQQRRMTS